MLRLEIPSPKYEIGDWVWINDKTFCQIKGIRTRVSIACSQQGAWQTQENIEYLYFLSSDHDTYKDVKQDDISATEILPVKAKITVIPEAQKDRS